MLNNLYEHELMVLSAAAIFTEHTVTLEEEMEMGRVSSEQAVGHPEDWEAGGNHSPSAGP